MQLIDLFEDGGRYAAADVIKDCEKFITKFNGNKDLVIYRGMKNKPKDKIEKFSVRLTDRSPVNISQENHKFINNYFIEKFDHPFRNGVFLTSNIRDAKLYGTPYAIFPIGDFEFLWSPKVIDLYTIIPNKNELVTEEWLDSKEYTNKKFIDAVTSKRELMFWCKEYYAIPVDMYTKQLRDDLFY